MSRQFSSKKRSTRTRKRKPVMLIIAEGRNQTETLYFDSFNNSKSLYTVKMAKGGNKTSPAKLLHKLEEQWNEYQLDESDGDIAFIVLDLDVDPKKAAEIKKLSEKTDFTTFIVSNPCFEVWFLLHFRYSTRGYIDSESVIKDLKKYLPAYTKSSNVSVVIDDLLQDALNNAYKLEEYYNSMGYKWPSVSRNPWTDVHKVINKLLGKE